MMSNGFFEHPILNSPYVLPAQHWELDREGQPTHRIVPSRRSAQFVTPIPKPKKRSALGVQENLSLYYPDRGLSTNEQQYDPTSIINEVRAHVAPWRTLPNPADWQVTPETARLLNHWRHYPFTGIRPFFCQVEAVETIIWLTEVAPKSTRGKTILSNLEAANQDANPALFRLALKLATGAGKTTVMAMLIAWQTINAVRRPASKLFTRGFLIVTPGLTIKDRLRVLLPNDPDNYYKNRQLVPVDMVSDIGRAKIVVTNYHALKCRERVEISKTGRRLLQGRTLDQTVTTETPGQMLQRVMPELLSFKNLLVLNDEAHHCYREKPDLAQDQLTGDDKKEADKNNETARLWISGLEAIKSKLGAGRVIDLSATPFFLRGSGYAEGTLFPWTVCDFSLMDAIECGIVKLPRVPVAQNIPGDELPMFRNLWEYVRSDMPKKGRGSVADPDPLALPLRLLTALGALYEHYEKTYLMWQECNLPVPPCFIIVCQNTAISKLLYDHVSGFYRVDSDGSKFVENGRLPLFRNFDEHGNPLARPNTILIDSEQLEAGDALDDNFRNMARDEIERFRRELVERSGDARKGDSISDQELLREVMNTVGKVGQLGASIRCVVSVSMLTEGWDANTVTHILGLRAFGTQLLCEQVIGRALRRQSYELNEEGLFDVEYADIFGIPFDFTGKPTPTKPRPPKPTIAVHAVSPERDALEITFPNIDGYRVELPREHLEAHFTAESTMTLTPELLGPSLTSNAGIIGQSQDMTLQHLERVRPATVVFHLTKHLLEHHWREPGEPAPLHLFGPLKQLARRWLDEHLVCVHGTFPAQLLYLELAERACRKITDAVTRNTMTHRPILAMVNPYNPVGSTRNVRFTTSKTDRWEPDPRKCHLNWLMLDSQWEAEFCRVAEAHPQVVAYVKNHHLGFEVPYRMGLDVRKYNPDFIAVVETGDGPEDRLFLVVEIKGFRGEDAVQKKETMDTYWVPGVNGLKTFGRWAFVELLNVHRMEIDFAAEVARLSGQGSNTPLGL